VLVWFLLPQSPYCVIHYSKETVVGIHKANYKSQELKILIFHFVGSHQLKLTEISRTVCDILSESLDPSMEGLSSWEKFGELLLGKNALELQTFKRFQSPTAAILNQKMGEAPTTTLGEVLDVLNEIGRKDVVEHVTKVIQNGGRLQEQISPPCLAQMHQSTSLDSGNEDAKTKADHAAPFQRSASLPVHAPVTTTSPSNGASSELEDTTRGGFDK